MNKNKETVFNKLDKMKEKNVNDFEDKSNGLHNYIHEANIIKSELIKMNKGLQLPKDLKLETIKDITRSNQTSS